MRYSGMLGVAERHETAPGVMEETIVEYPVLGTVEQRTEVLESSDAILPRYQTTTSISVRSRGIGPQDNSMIRYVTYAGTRWMIGSIVSDPPSLVIYIGEKYHGPTPE